MKNWEAIDRCPVCNHVEFDHFMDFKHREMTISYWTCQKCNVRFLNPRMTEERTEQYYRTDDYRKVTHEHIDQADQRLAKEQLGRAIDSVAWLKSFDFERRRVLEIGSGLGMFMRGVKEELGWPVTGVEWYKAHADLARSEKLNVFDDLAEARKTYGLIVMLHVLEHVNKPTKYLRKLRQTHAAEDGLLMVEVPNARAVQHAYVRHHVCAYARDSLNYLLELTGWEPIHWRFHSGVHGSPLDMYISVIAQAQ